MDRSSHRPDAIYVFNLTTRRIELFAEDWARQPPCAGLPIGFADAVTDNLVVHRRRPRRAARRPSPCTHDSPPARFALFGLGDFGPYFVPYLNEVAEVAAVCDPSPGGSASVAGTTGLRLPAFRRPRALVRRGRRGQPQLPTSRTLLPRPGPASTSTAKGDGRRPTAGRWCMPARQGGRPQAPAAAGRAAARLACATSRERRSPPAIASPLQPSGLVDAQGRAVACSMYGLPRN